MPQSYFKRFRMEIALRQLEADNSVPAGYQLIPWSDSLLDMHADAKYRSFRDELDSQVFPCLGEEVGCRRLMHEISRREGFVPAATWLAVYERPSCGVEYCGTIQGIHDGNGVGAVQNLGVTPEHRGKSLGRSLLMHALLGFRSVLLRRAFLEVTAQNESAVRLYRKVGFRHVKTVYKSSEAALANR